MSLNTHNRVSVMNLDNKMLNIDKKTIKKNKKRKNRQKTVFIEIKKNRK